MIYGDSIHWVCVLPKNVSNVDHPVKCFTVFKGYEWPFTCILDDVRTSLLVTTYHGIGQSCPQLGDTQFGNLRMFGFRQSNQASSNMGEVSDTINHNYWVVSTTNTSTAQQTAALSNALSEQAIDVQNHSGQVVIGLLKKVIMAKELWKAKSFDICQHTIMTMPHLNNKNGCF